MTAATNDATTNEITPPKKKTSVLRSRLLITAISLAIIWWLTLFWLSFFRANKPTPNYRQLFNSSYIVIVKTGDLDSASTVTVVKSVRGSLKKGTTIYVDNLEFTTAKNHQTYIFPLIRSEKKSFQVTPCPAPDAETKILTIYPHTPAFEEKIRKIVSP